MQTLDQMLSLSFYKQKQISHKRPNDPIRD